MKSVLVIGNPNSLWFKYYIEQILLKNEEFEISIQLNSNSECMYRDFYTKFGINMDCNYSLNKHMMNIPKIRALYVLYKRIVAIKKKYDCVIVFSSTIDNLIVAQHAKKKNGKMIDIVIGSDILRARRSALKLIDRVLVNNKSIIVCSAQKQANYMSQNMSCAKKLGILVIGFGLVSLSLIDQYRKGRLIDYKRKFGFLENTITVCIGYNGSCCQQHEKVIEALASLGQEEKQRIVLVLPMTYSLSESYYKRIALKLESHGFHFSILKRFMDQDEMAKLWLSTDIFINSQSTDAMSASLVECIYAGAYVINASWLKYPELDNLNIKLDCFDDFNELPNIITKYLSSSHSRDYSNCAKIGKYGMPQFLSKWKELFIKESLI